VTPMSLPAQPSTFETLALESSDEHVMIVRLNRPDVSNALNTQMGRDLVCFFEDVALDPASLRCIVLTGTGEKAFLCRRLFRADRGHAWHYAGKRRHPDLAARGR
jgi:enoyl-CoA hydratase